MGFYLRRYLGPGHASMSREQVESVTEELLATELALAYDVLSLAEVAIPQEHQQWDQRVTRARDAVRRLT